MKNINKKEVVSRHYKKILTAAGIVVVAGVTYVVFKKYVDMNKIIRELKTDNHTLMAACSEGLFEEAIATTTRKLNYRQDKLAYLINAKYPDKNVAAKIKELEQEVSELINRLDLFSKAQKLYAIGEQSD